MSRKIDGPVRSFLKKVPAAARRDGQFEGGERRRPSGLVTDVRSKCCADRTSSVAVLPTYSSHASSIILDAGSHRPGA
jgi:hypothetical protein